MAIVLICLILGLAIAIERIITLSLATVNTKKLVAELEGAISNGNIAEAQNICKATPILLLRYWAKGLSVLMMVLMLLKKLLYLTVVYKWDY